MTRLVEERLAEWVAVPAEPFGTLAERLADAAGRQEFDLVFVSQVLFESGFALVDLEMLVDRLADAHRLVVIDGYHGFLARPTDLSRIWRRVFYIAGGYKYAMAGEGACFMHCPPGLALRPRDTGWFAGFGDLSANEAQVEGQVEAQVRYADDASRFMGATFDPSGLYRFRAVLRWLSELKLDAAAIHAHAVALQTKFVSALAETPVGPLAREHLLLPMSATARGNFLVFQHAEAARWYRRLHDAGIITDVRRTRLRFGFGLQHAAADVDALIARLRAL
jgi:kynureninase